MMIDLILIFHHFPDFNPDFHSHNKERNVVPVGNFKMSQNYETNLIIVYDMKSVIPILF